MKRETIDRVLSSYFDALFDYIEARTPFEDSEDFRPTYELLLGEKLDPSLPPEKGFRVVLRGRIAKAMSTLKEPPPEELAKLEKIANQVKTIQRSMVWKALKSLIALFIPRGHGYGPSRMIEKKMRPRIVAQVRKLESEHPEWKREAIYQEVGMKFNASWRTIQDAYLEATRPPDAKPT